MPIQYFKGNLFTSKAQTLVNTVNCLGVMNAGIALEFRYRYPEMFEKYVEYCRRKLIQIGKLWIYDIPQSDKKILNFPTKYDWKKPSKYEYLEKGLQKFIDTYQEKGIISVAFPLLGTLNGKLDPEKVLSLMYQYLQDCPIHIEIYEYDPQAVDDLILPFRYIIENYPLKWFIDNSSISAKHLQKIKHILQDHLPNSLIQFRNYQGISEKIMQECFRLAMQAKEIYSKQQHQSIVQKDLFTTKYIVI
ncbi:MAG: macro domain-containing protein [Raineya sp.]|nr:macro domain-containing protein [Raineya sp.]